VPEILYLQFTNPTAYPPLEHGALILQRRGWRVRFLGVRWPESGNFRFPAELRGTVSLLPVPPPGWRQKLFYGRFLLRALVEALRRRPRWCYVSDPMAAPAGLLLRLLGFRVIYHEHDSPEDGPHSGFEAVIRWCRRELARRAHLNVLPQDARCRLFRAATGTQRPVLRVWNCPMREEVRPEDRPVRCPEDPLGIYYHGSINLTRVPLALIEAAGRTDLPVLLRVVGYETAGSRGVSEILRQAAREQGDLVQLEMEGAVPDREALFARMAGMHLGWIAYDERGADLNLRHLAGASNKAFDYLAAGLPLIVNDSPEWRELFVDSGVARCCRADDPDAIAVVFRWAYENPKEVAAMGSMGRRRILQEWNYEAQFSPVVAVLERKYTESDPRSGKAT
jgi:glycosyltransferase involved in cell wall biosynthesis